MPRLARHGWFVWAVLLTGCSQPVEPPYPEWAKTVPPFEPSASSRNAFDGYVLAARDAAKSAVVIGKDGKTRDLSNRTSFESPEKRMLIERLAPAVRQFRRASDLNCDFHFRPLPPGEADSNLTGWRLIRNSMVWQMESAIERGDFDTAIQLSVVATKAGFDLAHGGATHADVGLQFADDARRTIAPHTPYMGQSQLARLTSGLKRSLAAMPEFKEIAENEKQNFLAGVDWIQAHYRANKLDAVDEYLGGAVRDATTYLKQVRKDDRLRRPAYFQGFAKEAEATADWYGSQSEVPLVKRLKPDKMPLAKERPWKRYAAALFGTLLPIQTRYDATLARTRLMILSSEINRQIKAAGAAPKTLGAFNRELTTDPFIGVPLKYRPARADFRIYSVGANLQDDLGDTDSIFASPDLTLETGLR